MKRSSQLASAPAEREPVARPWFITFTGADEHTDIDRMVSLSRKYPIEWGILFSPKRQGEGRYPPMEFVRRLVNLGSLRLAAHLCGGDARSALEGRWPLPFGGFTRVQINTTQPDIDTEAVHYWAARMGLRAVLQCRGAFPKSTGVDWLFDQSGGRGVAPAEWPEPADAPCGYAGGIGPDNVREVLSKIKATDFWIDMESKVRDANDRFDLDLVERVCQAVYAAPSPSADPAEQAPSWLPLRLDAEQAALVRDTIGRDETDGSASPVTIDLMDGPDGPGVYVWLTEYPEEGSICLTAQPPENGAPT